MHVQRYPLPQPPVSPPTVSKHPKLLISRQSDVSSADGLLVVAAATYRSQVPSFSSAVVASRRRRIMADFCPTEAALQRANSGMCFSPPLTEMIKHPLIQTALRCSVLSTRLSVRQFTPLSVRFFSVYFPFCLFLSQFLPFFVYIFFLNLLLPLCLSLPRSISLCLSH